MVKPFRPYDLDQRLLLPPDLREWLPDDHLALFVSDVVDGLDLSAILDTYESGDGRGQPPYHPAMMVKLLLYAYCVGKPSSRKIERATYEDVAFRVLAADQHPDHDTIAEFRQRHLPALARLFVQGLLLCQRAGLVTLGHVALDSTRIKANASKHKAMSYARMEESERELQRQVQELLDQAQQVDATEDARYGRGRRGDELPAELARRESRLRKIREARAALEAEAQERARRAAQEAKAKLAARNARVGRAKGAVPKVPDPEQARPAPSAQRNFTDPDSRIMKDPATKSFEQAYSAQAAVDGHRQIIVACSLSQSADDTAPFVPMLEQVQANVGRLPAVAMADAGFFSDANLRAPQLAAIDLYVPPDRVSHGTARRNPQVANPVAEGMREKLRTAVGDGIYRQRKAIIEPVFGQIKEVRGFRRFTLRGLTKVTAEWTVICLTHNLLKLFRASVRPQPA
ncbi:MAG: IS1182 family transposase [Candidatus Rokuibacteriota bacterium]|nr:MAG: IS1182 family transposase [Candidatus Rokubacteria bacterium]PYM65818.1 MAG: IS1182 family transposase [Candidatus Rokubacteria bacterium]